MTRRSIAGPRATTRFLPAALPLEERLMPSADVLTYHEDAARSGWDPNEGILNPANVNASSFGKQFTMNVDGKVDAEPLYVGNVRVPGRGVDNVLYLATEHDSLYAFNADDGSQLWKVSILPAGEVPSDPVFGSQVTPEIGITDTPVIDPTTGTMYLVAMSKSTAGGTTAYHQRIHAVDLASGADRVAPRSIDASITYPGAGPGGNGSVVAFDPKQYEERDALALANGVVYTGWASHSDHAPYTGWVIGFRTSDLGLALVLDVDPNGAPVSSFLDDGSGNSFWNSAGGPAVDGYGNLYNLSANGPFDPLLNAAGFPANGDYGDTFLKLTPTASGLTVSDYFTPANQQVLANGDLDLGSSGVALANEPGPNGTTLHLAIGSDKSGDIFVVNRDAMGKYRPSGDAIIEEIPGTLGGAEFGTPTVYGNLVYFGAVGQPIRMYSILPDGHLQPIGTTLNAFGYPGPTSTVSSYGVQGGIVWALENGPSAVLHAYLATNLADELYNSNQAPGNRDAFGVGNKFITPTVANGRVYVATTTGVTAFGLLPGPPPTIVRAPSANPSVTLGTSVVLSALGADAQYPESALIYAWSTIGLPAGAPAPTFSAQASNAAKTTVATFSRAGTYTFQLLVQDGSYRASAATVAVQVVPLPTSVVVSPATSTLAWGQSEQLKANIFDQFGQPFPPVGLVDWSLYGASPGTVTQAGLYTAPSGRRGTGQATIVVGAGQVYGTATVTLVPPATTAVVPARPAVATARWPRPFGDRRPSIPSGERGA